MNPEESFWKSPFYTQIYLYITERYMNEHKLAQGLPGFKKEHLILVVHMTCTLLLNGIVHLKIKIK